MWLYKFLLTSTVCLKRCLARRILKPIIFHRFTGNWKPYFNHIKSLWLTFSTSFSHRGAKECQSVLILEKWHNKKNLRIYFFEIFSFLPQFGWSLHPNRLKNESWFSLGASNQQQYDFPKIVFFFSNFREGWNVLLQLGIGNWICQGDHYFFPYHMVRIFQRAGLLQHHLTCETIDR